MFVVIQLPFADARPFVSGAKRLRTPPWPLAEPDHEFVRSVGQVKQRQRGGVVPWAGEEVYCDARRALRIQAGELDRRFSSCRFRRYFSDGLALTRVEVGIALPSSSPEGSIASPSVRGDGLSRRAMLDQKTVSESLSQALGVIFHTPAADGSPSGNPLELRRALARHLMRSTTSFKVSEPFYGEDWWLEPAHPLILLECGVDEDASPPPGSRKVSIANEHGITLYTFVLRASGTAVRVWLVNPRPCTNSDALRRLRIHLLRLHSERMALRGILRSIALERLDTSRGSAAFDRLQRYLLDSSRAVQRRQSYGFAAEPILDAAYRADAIVSESERNTILDQLKRVRLNILKDVERRLMPEHPPVSQATPNVIHLNVDGDLIQGDRYEIAGPVGALGPGAHIDSMRIEQVCQELAPRIDLDRLQRELKRLHEELTARAMGHDSVRAEVAQAAVEAKRGSGPRALAHLALAGRWALSTATDIGADLTASVIKQLLNL